MEIVNITGYKFVNLVDTEVLRSTLYQRASELDLRGTVLLSDEGINLNLAGSRESAEAFKEFIREDIRFADVCFKESLSAYPPFNRLKVKIKAEIITMKARAVSPGAGRARVITPEKLKQWLDEKRDLVLLDARNEFEVKAGSFEKALSLGLNSFSEFPQAITALDEPIKQKPVVTFCTGGIRCEKAALYLEAQGYREVYQLDGGILNYFARCGSAHYQGECFVFDHRISLNPKLEGSTTSFNTPATLRSHYSAKD
jgi:UPF0176 protein